MSDVETAAPNRGNAGKGRPKGSLNKVTLAAREAILLAAEGLGGVERLIQWVNKDDENEKIFWSVIYPKVLPLGGGPSEAPPMVTGALVWRGPDEVEAETAIAAAEVAADAADAAADGTAEPAIAAAEPADATADGAAVEEAAAETKPRGLGARVVWKAPDPGATGGLPGLPGGPSVAATLGSAAERPPPPVPPPKA